MKANTITKDVLTLTPEEFAAKFLPILQSQETDTTPTDYFVRNLDTGKLELHITKPTYKAYDAETKQAVWDNFKWSRECGCWIEREASDPTDFDALWLFATQLGLADGGYFVTMHADGAQHDSSAAKADMKKPVANAKLVADTKPVAAVKCVTPAKAAKVTETVKRHETISPVNVVIDDDEICHALRRGSHIEGGKIRIAAFYSRNPTSDEAKAFLKEEYGIGGGTHDLLCGARGMVDHNGKGITIKVWDANVERQLSWTTVHTYLRDMIKRGDYLDEKEQKRYDEIKKQYHGKLPKPAPRFGFPSVKSAS